MLFVVSSPSGAGKTTLCRRLISEFPHLVFSVSYTTRPKRSGETAGVDYFFIDDRTFERMVEEGAFAEWAVVHGNRYGTASATIDSSIGEGTDLLFDIDWQGARALRARYPGDTEMVFVLPPGMPELARRLRGRGTDSPDVVRRRLERATGELEHFGEYDFLVINEDVDAAYAELKAIYQAQRCTQRRRASFAMNLLKEPG